MVDRATPNLPSRDFDTTAALEDSGLRIGALVDTDCTLLRLIQNP